jgi:hypothetical protein
VQTGVLERTIVLPFAKGEPSSVYNFNDCLILSMLALPRQDNLLTRALSPLVPVETSWAGDAITGLPALHSMSRPGVAVERRAKPRARRLLAGIGGCTGAIVLCFLVKMGVAAAVWGRDVLVDFGLRLSVHVVGSGWDIASEPVDKL